MATTVPTWIREEAAAGNGKPYAIWSLGLDPADMHHWAIAISNQLIEQDPPYELAPGPGGCQAVRTCPGLALLGHALDPFGAPSPSRLQVQPPTRVDTERWPSFTPAWVMA